MSRTDPIPFQQSNVHRFSDDARILMSTLAAVAPSVVYIFNVETQTAEFTSDSVGRLIGYSTDEVRVMGKDFMQVLCHPDDLAGFHAHLGQVMALTGDDTLSFEYRMRTHDGHWHWFVSHDKVLERGPSGEILRLIGTATNIHSNKMAEIAAIQERDAVAELNENLEAFSHSMTHDIRAPVNTMGLVLSELTLIPAVAADADAMALIDMGLSVSARFGHLVENLSKHLLSDKSAAEFEDVDLQSVLSEVVVDLSAHIHEASADVRLGLLPKVLGTEVQLRILFQNLIENAIKYHHPDRRPVVDVSDVTPPNSPDWLISVADNGVGIDEDQHSKIFDTFQRADARETTPGSGLGLSICKRIAQFHGGSIQVASGRAQGAELVLHLPQSRRP